MELSVLVKVTVKAIRLNKNDCDKWFSRTDERVSRGMRLKN